MLVFHFLDRDQYFLRGRPFLIQHMSRVKVKGTGIRPRSNPLEEPDFWKGMSWVGLEGGSTATPPPPEHYSSSVVSRDDSRYNDTDTTASDASNDENNEYTPIPPAIVASEHRQRIIKPQGVPAHAPIPIHCSVDDQDLSKLMGWGKPFYYIDSAQIAEPVSSAAADGAVRVDPVFDTLMEDAELAAALNELISDSDIGSLQVF